MKQDVKDVVKIALGITLYSAVIAPALTYVIVKVLTAYYGMGN